LADNFPYTSIPERRLRLTIEISHHIIDCFHANHLVYNVDHQTRAGIKLQYRRVVPGPHFQPASNITYSFIIYFYLFIICFKCKLSHSPVPVYVKNHRCVKVTCHCRKARPYRADFSLFVNVHQSLQLIEKSQFDEDCSTLHERRDKKHM